MNFFLDKHFEKPYIIFNKGNEHKPLTEKELKMKLIAMPIIEIAAYENCKTKYIVWPNWNTDKKNERIDKGTGIDCGHDMKLAKRTLKAIQAGAICINPTLCKRKDGTYFVQYNNNFRHRCLNADLKKMGF